MAGFGDFANRILGTAMNAFGENVTFYPKAGGVYPGRGVFDNQHQTIDPDTQQVITVNQPTLGIRLADFSDIDLRQGDEIDIRGIRFRISDRHDDGQGGSSLLLNKVKASDRIPNA